ncbi:hypothetical protein CPLU01_14144 [Colletotrichum plurivorum]|uniref:Uncharacterized protein n=1 Tax=Colletotrichum plurivorum TaxID=2175906 RepID=A0A8H6N050_9PEZI|nr:hypothetical protein CPLU01_14144 [Colletotrichum plurivorum]
MDVQCAQPAFKGSIASLTGIRICRTYAPNTPSSDAPAWRNTARGRATRNAESTPTGVAGELEGLQTEI